MSFLNEKKTTTLNMAFLFIFLIGMREQRFKSDSASTNIEDVVEIFIEDTSESGMQAVVAVVFINDTFCIFFGS
jgi:hypothetical protein